MAPVVDMHGEVRTPGRQRTARATWQSVSGYNRLFGGTGETEADTEPEDLSAADLDELARLDVVYSVLHAKQPSGIRGEWDDAAVNDQLAETLALSDRLLGFYAIDVHKHVALEIDRISANPQIIGAKLNAVYHGIRSDDRLFYPLYEACQERSQVIWIHSGNNWDDSLPMDLTHPKRIDRIACDFPDLSIIIGHGGWPWMLDACTVAWRHPNVYLDVSAHRPRHMIKPGTGWEPLFGLGHRPVRDKVLFGSAWELVGASLTTVLDEFGALPMEPDVIERWRGANALELLGRHGVAARS